MLSDQDCSVRIMRLAPKKASSWASFWMVAEEKP